jgi:hypothetical protein
MTSTPYHREKRVKECLKPTRGNPVVPGVVQSTQSLRMHFYCTGQTPLCGRDNHLGGFGEPVPTSHGAPSDVTGTTDPRLTVYISV